MVVRFRARPSSVLQYGSTLAGTRIGGGGQRNEEGFGDDDLRRLIEGAGDFFRTIDPGRAIDQYILDPVVKGFGLDEVMPWQVGPNSPSSTGGASKFTPPRPTAEDFGLGGSTAVDGYQDDALGATTDIFNSQFNDPQYQAEIEYLNQKRALEQKEAALRRAMLDGDLTKARELLKDIEANKQALAQSYAKWRATVSPVQDARIPAVEAAGSEAEAKLQQIASTSSRDLAATQAQAEGEVEEFGALIGNTEAGVEAAQDLAVAGMSEFADLISGRHESFLNLSTARTAAATAEARADQAFQRHMLGLQEEGDLSSFEGMADDAANRISDLEMQRKIFDIQQQQADLAHQRALERIEGQTVDMDALTFGRANANNYLMLRAEAMGMAPDRMNQIWSMWEEAYSQGVYSPEEWRKWFVGADADGNRVQADEGWVTPLTPEEQALIGQMFDSYVQGRNRWESGEVQPKPVVDPSSDGRTGTGGRISTRNNRAVGQSAKSPDSGPYYHRQRYAAQMLQYAISTFGVRSSGQWRSTSVEPTGARAANSDHYSGGAIDLSGSPAAMQAAANYFKNNPAVSYVLYKTPGHYDHVHVSFNLDYFS